MRNEKFFSERDDVNRWQNIVVYQIYPKSFCDTTGTGSGDLKGITGKLDYLKNLGVDAIWLTPIYPSPMVDNGYDISDYTSIDPAYGTPEDFDELISEARKRNIFIIMDLVYNHSSDKHAWFLESKSGRKNPKSDWYIWRDAKPDGSPPTNWRGIFGGSAWTWCEERRQYYLHTFAKEQPDLNWENPDVRRALYDAANFWLEKGVGGFRIDAIVYIKKPPEFSDGKPDEDGTCSVHNMTAGTPGILDFLHEFRREVFDGKNILTVAEANSVKPEELNKWVGKDGVFDMLFEFNHVNIMFPGGETWHAASEWKLSDWKKTFTASQKATAHNGRYPIFFENHDKPRAVNNFFPPDADKKLAAKALATVLFTLRGTPFVFEGQELGYQNVAYDSIDAYDDISSHGQYKIAIDAGFSQGEALKFVQRFSRDNARTPMQWTAGRNAGFTSGKAWLPIHDDYKTCNAETEEDDENSVLNFYKKIIALRKSNKTLIEGRYEEFLPESERVFAFKRILGDEIFYTVVNFTMSEIILPEEIFEGAEKILGNYDDESKNILRPLESVIYRKISARKN